MTFLNIELKIKPFNYLERFFYLNYSQKFNKFFKNIDFFFRILVSIILPYLALTSFTNTLPLSALRDQTPINSGGDTGKMSGPVSIAPSSEWLLAAYGGAPYTYPSDVHINKSENKDFTLKDVEWQGLPFVNPIYYGARVIRWFSNTRFGAMLDFTHSKAISVKEQKVLMKNNLQSESPDREVLIKEIFNRLEASHGHNMLTLNGMLRLPSLGFGVSPYIGLGAGIALPHAEVHIAGDSKRTYEYQLAGPVGQGLLGLEIRLPKTSYFFEYKFTFADYRMPLSGRDGYILFTDLWRQFRRWLEGQKPVDGWAETKFISHQVVGGLGVRLKSAFAQ